MNRTGNSVDANIVALRHAIISLFIRSDQVELLRYLLNLVPAIPVSYLGSYFRRLYYEFDFHTVHALIAYSTYGCFYILHLRVSYLQW